MGLRFRKSITLCKGVRLNLGKTGASVTFGQKGYHKTISTSGRVTTSVGIPGTGIYWTDTQQIGGKRTRQNSNSYRNQSQRIYNEPAYSPRPSIPTLSHPSVEHNSSMFSGNTVNNKSESALNNSSMPAISQNNEVTNERELIITPKKEREWDRERYEKSKSVEYEAGNDDIDFFMDPLISIRGSDVEVDNQNSGSAQGNIFIKRDSLYEIYGKTDPPILWNDILLGNSAEDLQMDIDTWNYCREIADGISKGDIDTYLEAISELAPLDDLLWYGSDFEFGTDDPNYIETEFIVYPSELLEYGENDALLLEYIEAVSLRVARDMLALLPVKTAVVHVTNNNKDLFSGIFERTVVDSLDFTNRNISELMMNIRFAISGTHDDRTIRRLSL